MTKPTKNNKLRFSTAIFYSFWYRLVFGAGGVGLFFILVMSVAFLVNTDTYNHSQKVIKYYKPLHQQTIQIREGIQDCINVFNKGIYSKTNIQEKESQEAYFSQELQEIWRYEVKRSLDSVATLIKNTPNEAVEDIFNEIKTQLNRLYRDFNSAIQAVGQPKQEFLTEKKDKIYFNPTLAEVIEREILPTQRQINKLFDQLNEKQQIDLSSKNIALATNLQIYNWVITGLIIFSMIILYLAVGNIHSFLLQEEAPIKLFLEQLNQGNIPPKVKVKSAEFTQIATLLNLFARQLHEVEKFALEVGKKNYESDIKMFGDKGNLGEALAKMRDSLRQIAETNAIRYWTNTGIAKFSEILTRNADNLNKLADEFLKELVNYLEINQGGFFIVEDTPQGQVMELKATYAYNKKKYIHRTIEKGEGLLGQAWNEGNTIYLKEIPKDYIEITSGLGGAVPQSLLIVPFASLGKIFGLLELASFQDIPTYKREFVEKIAEFVGSAIAGTKNNEHTKRLLEESLQKTRMLQQQEELLRANMRELQAAQKQMRITQDILASKEANLDAVINNTSHAIIAFDKDYNITVVNNVMRALYWQEGVKLEVGKNLLQEIPSKVLFKRQLDFQRVLRGEKFTKLEIEENGFEKVYYEHSYNPIFNENKEVIGASIFTENITQSKLAEEAVKQTEANLISLINNTTDGILALNRRYQIIVINEVYAKELQKNTNKEVKLNTSIFEYLPEVNHEDWRKLYNQALQGERFVKVFERGKYPNKTYRENWFNPIRNEKGEVVGLSIFARDITEAKKSEIKIKQLLLETLDAADQLKQQEEKMIQQVKEYQKQIEILEQKLKQQN
ncbi:MAG: PAS domain-containing protein [Microscillaceae bacterium]|nr:PAS domain-containing protein [Microscillaceae bacterium]MDW8459859.1 PAS domain-containing protein [Cytophagales bacterium]